MKNILDSTAKTVSDKPQKEKPDGKLEEKRPLFKMTFKQEKKEPEIVKSGTDKTNGNDKSSKKEELADYENFLSMLKNKKKQENPQKEEKPAYRKW